MFKNRINKLSFEEKIFFYCVVFAFFISIIMIIENLIINFPFHANYKWFISIIASGIAIYSTYYQKWYLKIIQYIIFSLVIFVLYPLGSLAIGANNNYSFSYAFMILICLCYFFEDKARWFFVVSEIFVVILLLISSIYYPHIFLEPDKKVLQIDILFQIPMTLISCAILTTIFSNEHRNEKKSLLEYSKLLDMQNKALEQISITDDLTGLYNRKYVVNYMESLELSSTYVYFVGMIDIDNFKQINDTYGHEVGDNVIKNVSHQLHNVLNEYGVVGRYGGDEFIAFIVASDECHLIQLIEKLKSLQLYVPSYKSKVTLSGGFVKFEAYENIDNALYEADQLLYKVKIEGKANIISSLDLISN